MSQNVAAVRIGPFRFSSVHAIVPKCPGTSSLRDRATFGELPHDLYVVPGPWPRLGRPVKHDIESWCVIDDWPARDPVTDAEIDILNGGGGGWIDCSI